MRELTAFEVDALTATDTYRGFGAFNPRLVFEIFLFGQSRYMQFIGIKQIHSSLQGDVTFEGRTIPCCVLEDDISEDDVMHGTFEGARHFDKRLKHGGRKRKVFTILFAFCRIIVNRTSRKTRIILIPSTGLYETFSAQQIERRSSEYTISPILVDDGLRPRVLELKPGLGFLEFQFDDVSFEGVTLYTKNSNGPTLMQNHLKIAYFPIDIT